MAAHTPPAIDLPAGPSGLVFNIMRFSTHDGPGIRTTVFLKGCSLHCFWCHNPEGRKSEPEAIHLEERCTQCGDCVRACPHGALHLNGRLFRDLGLCQRCGECADVCPVSAQQLAGRWMSVHDTLVEILKDEVFFDESGGGVTVSGGEPLMQPEFVEALLRECKARRIRTALDTCGYAATGILQRVSENVDLFLYDLKVMDPEKHRQFTGVGNELILNNLKMLVERGSAVTVRVPIIPGVNADAANFSALVEFLAPLGLREIDLLPYHRIGSAKYSRLHLSYQMEGMEPPMPAQMDAVAARLTHDGFSVRIGG